MSKEKATSFLGLILVVILWGIAPVISDYLFNNGLASPALLTAIRGLLSVVVMGIIIVATKKYKLINKSYLICIPAGVFLGAAYLFQFIGLKYSTPAKNTFLESFSCFAVPLTMFILVKEKPNWVTILAVLGCLVGSFVLCAEHISFSSKTFLGDVLSATGGIFFGIDIAFTKVFAKGKDPLVYVFFQLIILTIMGFAYAFPFEKVAFSWDWVTISHVVILGVVCTALCWVLRTACISHVSAVACAVLMPMSAVICTLISVLVGTDKFSWYIIGGGLIITLSIVLSGLYDAKQDNIQKEGSQQNEQDSCQ